MPPVDHDKTAQFLVAVHFTSCPNRPSSTYHLRHLLVVSLGSDWSHLLGDDGLVWRSLLVWLRVILLCSSQCGAGAAVGRCGLILLAEVAIAPFVWAVPDCGGPLFSNGWSHT